MSSLRQMSTHLHEQTTSQAMKSYLPNENKSRNAKSIFAVDAKLDGFKHDDSVQPLSWRDDPSDSLSDWTIEASCDTNEDDNEVDSHRTYHVHRAILGAGSRKCLYFSSLFARSSCREHESNTSKISFDSAQELDIMESMLDYIYSGRYVPVESPVVARHFCFYFQCKAFIEQVNQQIARELTPQKVTMHLLEADKYKDERVKESATTLCAQSLQNVGDKDLGTLPLELMLSILDSPHLACPSLALSLKVRSYLATNYRNGEQLTSKILFDLTQAMPEIDPVAARAFLRLLQNLDATSDGWSRLQSLATRCADAIALTGFKTMDVQQLQQDFDKDWSASGKWHQDGNFCLLHVTSALARAQEVCTLQEWEISNLTIELEALKLSQVAAASNFELSELNRPDVLEALDATIEETVAQTLEDYLHNHSHWAAGTRPRPRRATQALQMVDFDEDVDHDAWDESDDGW